MNETVKKSINVGTIGHVDHGKTTLTAAISKRMSERFGGEAKAYSDIDNSKEERERGITINQTTIKYETDKRIYSHTDCPGHRDFIKNMIVGVTQLDAVIVVVSLYDGPMLQTMEHLLLVKRLGIENLIVFLNKEDLIPVEDLEEQKELVRYNMIDILENYQFNMDKVEFVFGSAVKAMQNVPEYVARIDQLIDLMEEKFEIPERRINEKLIMTIEGVKNIPGRGKVATGIVEQGSIKVGQDVDVIGLGKDVYKTKVISMESFHKSYNEVLAGQNVGVLLRNNDKLTKGQVISEHNYLKSSRTFEGELYALSEADGGRNKPFGAGNKYSPQFFFVTADITGTLYLDEGIQNIFPGDNVKVKVKLINDVAMYVGQNVTLREGGCTIATMKITKVGTEI